ncbi:rod shape-determining protein MreD [Novosphingobium sp.]|uniref:rod shape-determining protein MreD n=1 Tax=Novosphingobium sp. TaxID=1874826 RepID=UPI0035B35E2D
MAQTLSDSLHGITRVRINRAPSPVLAIAAPWLLVILGSLAPLLPLIASAPVVPPLGFLFLVAWQQLRPGLFPIWAGLPLGLIDDLYSGQPMGSAVLLWSAAMIALDIIEMRFPWRDFAHNWVAAAAIIVAYILLSLGIANHGGGHTLLPVLVPQLVISVLCYPLAARLVGRVDRLRLMRVRKI